MAKWQCNLCGWIYDEAKGDTDNGVAPGTAWAQVPDSWTCPECGADKSEFTKI